MFSADIVCVSETGTPTFLKRADLRRGLGDGALALKLETESTFAATPPLVPVGQRTPAGASFLVRHREDANGALEAARVRFHPRPG